MCPQGGEWPKFRESRKFRSRSGSRALCVTQFFGFSGGERRGKWCHPAPMKSPPIVRRAGRGAGEPGEGPPAGSVGCDTTASDWHSPAGTLALRRIALPTDCCLPSHFGICWTSTLEQTPALWRRFLQGCLHVPTRLIVDAVRPRHLHTIHRPPRIAISRHLRRRLVVIVDALGAFREV
jgi:hypothetical protein